MGLLPPEQAEGSRGAAGSLDPTDDPRPDHPRPSGGCVLQAGPDQGSDCTMAVITGGVGHQPSQRKGSRGNRESAKETGQRPGSTGQREHAQLAGKQLTPKRGATRVGAFVDGVKSVTPRSGAGMSCLLF